jgi:hypothetical protein
LLALFFVQGILASRLKSPVFDEPFHISAGLSYIEYREVVANPQHPPLLKELAGISLWLAGIRLPPKPEVRPFLETGGEASVGSAMLMLNGADRVLFWSRLPFLLLSTGLGLLIFVFGRQLFGDIAALCAVFLYVFDPTMLGHSYLATFDMGLAAFAMLFFWALWNHVRKPGIGKLIACGAAMGCMMVTKFSAVVLLPVALILLLSAARGATLFPPITGYFGALAAFVAMLTLAMIVVAMVYLSPGGLVEYAAGALQVNADHNSRFMAVLAGQLGKRFPSYFVSAWFLKEPVATVLLVLLGLFVLVRVPISRTAKLCVLFPAIAVVAFHTIMADDIGIRYVIPAMPFAYLIGGTGAAWMIARRSIWLKLSSAALGGWVLLAGIGIYPDHLSYFNESACIAHPSWIGFDGGTRCGPLWLADSNVDWGQGLKQLHDWITAHPVREPKIRLAYFGIVPTEVYGLPSELFDGDHLLTPPPPGRIVVSSHFVASMPAWAKQLKTDGADWLTRAPTAVVGHSWYIFDIH